LNSKMKASFTKKPTMLPWWVLTQILS